MSIEIAIRARLAGFAGLSALVGTRIYPNFIPEGSTLPAIAYEVISAERESAMGADIGTSHFRIQLTIFATSYSETGQLLDVATQTRLALQRFSGTVAGVEICNIFIENDLDIYGENVVQFQRIQDYKVSFVEA